MNTHVVGSVVEAGIRRGGSFDPKGAIQVKVPLRAGGGTPGQFGASIHSASQLSCRGRDGECSAGSRRGTDPSYDLWCAGAQPNQRLKLAAPVPEGSRERFPCGVVEFYL